MLAVAYSTLSEKAISDYIAENYHIKPIEVNYLIRGINDTYVVKDDHSKYVFRVYRSDWRSHEDEVAFELELLIYLKNQGIPVSYPIAKIDGHHINTLYVPEGKRFGVLFSYADGEETPIDNENISLLFGKAVAELHQKTTNFTSNKQRSELNLEFLIDHPLEVIQKAMVHRSEDFTFIEEVAIKLKNRIQELEPKGLDWGICHGDLHGNQNISFCNDLTYTHYDFDICGYGWRAYDIAEFRLARQYHTNGDKELLERLWSAFLEGYTSIRELSQNDLAAIPVFVWIRELWLMGLCFQLRHIDGGIDTGDDFIDEKIDIFKKVQL
ncbi:phosphotransferase [Heyndrickxia oleronia]|uniref:Phosphotransferase n=1 Tax=Heyndrickxia oleronia TaxID=38875 RepID=A0AAW6T4H7_9BACI|nr:phosphotransferase [Heyndrickxia oleronia]MDH5163957.1 phosphotransferase [Heyndrickxia oleronia]